MTYNATLVFSGNQFQKDEVNEESTGRGLKDNSFGTYAKFSEKLTFLTPGYTHLNVRIWG